MIISEATIKRIRTLLNEQIPETGTDKDTNFSDVDLTITIQRAENENHALYLLWTQKAGLVQKNIGTIKSIHAGGEYVEKYTASDYVALCLKTAAGYHSAWEADKANEKVSSFLIYSKKEKGSLW